MSTVIADFLRRPESAIHRLADAVRLLAAASVVVAGLGWGWIQVAVFLLAVLATLLPRALSFPGWLDLATGAAALLAAWSNAWDLYTTVPGWDTFIHAYLGGAVALLAVSIAQRAGAAPSPVPGSSGRRTRLALVLLTAAFGLATGALWEMLEWFGHTVIDPGVHVGYDDTIGDLAAGGLGSLLLGIVRFGPPARHRTPEGSPPADRGQQAPWT